MPIAPPLLTVRDVAEQLRLSAASIYEMVRIGQLPAVRLGARRGAIRIRPEDIAQYLAAGMLPPPATTPRTVAPRAKLQHIRL